MSMQLVAHRERLLPVTDTSPLAKYILSLCDRQGLSMREASIRAGLGTETIGVIVRRGKTTTPRPDTLRAIADALGGSFEHMMVLAEHLPPPPPNGSNLPPEYQAKVREIVDIWRELGETSPSALLDLLNVVAGQAAMMKAAVRANTENNDRTEEEQQPREQQNS